MTKEEVFFMLIKGMGSLFVILACVGMALQYGAGLDAYIGILYQIKQIAEMIQTELEYSAYPLGEIFEKTAQRLPDGYAKYFSEMSRRITENDGIELPKLWTTTMDKLADEQKLKQNHRKLLLDLGALLNDRNVFQITNGIQGFRERMDIEIAKEQIELSQRKRIYHCVWIFGGFLLVILLL